MNRLARFGWIVVAYNLAVIGWGAYVRASDSGNGCGAHWPLCNGVVVPRAPELATIVELTHRLTSGLALIGLIALVVAVWRGRPKGHPARRAAAWSLAFMLTEAGVGAGLVLLELVGDNDSLARAVVMAIHLANTFLLLGAMTLTARWLEDRPVGLSIAGRGGRATTLALLASGVLIVSISGAVAALGDTLFPATSLSHALEQDLSPTAHVLIRLRLFHPTLAVLVALALLAIAPRLAVDAGQPASRGIASGTRVAAIAALQLGLGALNVLLLAPVWLQLVHLLVADLLWIAVILLGAGVLAPGAAAAYAVSAVGPYIAGTGTSSIRR